MRALLFLVVVLAVVAAPGFERPAAALSCAIPAVVGGGEPTFPDPYKGDYDAIVEGIALSGPSLDGELGAPARFFVTRWIKGRGPRIVPVGTALHLGVGRTYGRIPGFFDPKPGEVSRLFADRDRFGILHDNPCLFGDERPGPRSPLRMVARSEVRRSAAGRSWRARAQRGGGVHCVVVHPARGHTGGGRECEFGRPLLAVHHDSGRDVTRSTAIVLAGTGIGSVTLKTPDGPIAAKPKRNGAPVLAVLPGHVDAAEVRARVVLADGSVRWLQPVGYPTALTPDPELGRPWRSVFDDGFSFQFDAAVARDQCVGAAQLPERTGGGGLSTFAVCGDLRRDPYFFAVERPAPSPLDRSDRPEPLRTVVLGAARPSVAEIVVRDPGGERRLVRGPGGQFAAVYPASVLPAALEVTVVFRDGTTVTHRGRSGANRH